MGLSDIPFQPGGDSYIERAVGTDDSSLRAQSPVYHADKIKVPIIIAHGEIDRRVPIFHAHDLRNALDKEGIEYEWLIESGEAHVFF